MNSIGEECEIVNTHTCGSGYGSGEISVNMQAYIAPGCGSDLTSRSTDRISLQSSASKHVAAVWKALLQVDQEGPDTVTLIIHDRVRGVTTATKNLSSFTYTHIRSSLVICVSRVFLNWGVAVRDVYFGMR